MPDGARDVVVVGGGIVGLAVAWRAARAGLTVTVLDPSPGDGATHAAAGMLAPVTEADFGEDDALRLHLAAAAAWPGFAGDLHAATGADVGLRTAGTLTLAYDADDLALLRRVLALHAAHGLTSRELTVADARRLEPYLGPRVAGAAWAPADHAVDPRATHRALLGALDGAGGGRSPARTTVPRRAPPSCGHRRGGSRSTRPGASWVCTTTRAGSTRRVRSSSRRAGSPGRCSRTYRASSCRRGRSRGRRCASTPDRTSRWSTSCAGSCRDGRCTSCRATPYPTGRITAARGTGRSSSARRPRRTPTTVARPRAASSPCCATHAPSCPGSTRPRSST
nr:FAD-dependent oxidoreductase [Cellulosimicrobium cellulans]